MRIFVHLSYKGTQYRGWQRQAASLPDTVQQIVEEALIKILKYDCYISGCGRTDAGVHASTFYFSLDLKEKLDFDFCERFNRVLPNDIVANDFKEVGEANNTRFDATERVYNYYFHLNANPFDDEVSTFIDYNLNLDKMIEASTFLSGLNDFKFLCKQPEKHRTTFCNINHIVFYTNKERTHFRVEISADRFLRGMIRLIMSRLFLIGNDKIDLHELKLWVKGEFDLHSKPAYPQGLFLTDVRYDFIDSEKLVSQNMPNQKAWILL